MINADLRLQEQKNNEDADEGEVSGDESRKTHG